MNNLREDMISFYRQWIIRLQTDGRIAAACCKSQKMRREMLEIYNRKIIFLRKCIAYQQAKKAA